ncbi:hypothetical protein B0H19DRAFT_1112040 [Mycena capillaripes]|nr:hypothetical protein B0H19DRAFT_1112040 [Mycena capillaripes]
MTQCHTPVQCVRLQPPARVPPLPIGSVHRISSTPHSTDNAALLKIIMKVYHILGFL